MTKRLEFTNNTKVEAFRLAAGKCQKCTRKVGYGTKLKVEYDHIKACVFESDNSLQNCMVLCVECHTVKTGRDITSLSKVKRNEKKTAGIEKPRSQWGKRPMNSNFKPNVRRLDDKMGGYRD